ncbi:hypothetical protein C1645_827649 [Glomus cerebriforme]|uniref:Uncharacterized protein n=1 Tax=Glomus cerebriforme TaxID=658196 RepID=A0A397SMW9_9GLOM|nr:hypothetical protein C1645_827649 [Glomus cerebriforme]
MDINVNKSNGNLYKQENEYGIMHRDHLDIQFLYSHFKLLIMELDLFILKIIQQPQQVYANFYKPDMDEFTDQSIVYTTIRFSQCVLDTLGIVSSGSIDALEILDLLTLI